MIKILYNDKSFLVCIKPAGIISEAPKDKRQNMPELLKKQTHSYRIDVVHRLDKAVGGVMVYSKNAKATSALSHIISGRSITKEYIAVLNGCPETPEGELYDYLWKDSKKQRSFVVGKEHKDAKESQLEYKTIKTVTKGKEKFTLVKIRLHTGRYHQIRVQFASRKMPLLYDEKYGFNDTKKDIALWCFRIAFKHPFSNETIDVSAPPKEIYPWSLFTNEIKGLTESCESK